VVTSAAVHAAAMGPVAGELLPAEAAAEQTPKLIRFHGPSSRKQRFVAGDLLLDALEGGAVHNRRDRNRYPLVAAPKDRSLPSAPLASVEVTGARVCLAREDEIGRASCRERVV